MMKAGRYIRKDPTTGEHHIGTAVVCDCGALCAVNEVYVVGTDNIAQHAITHEALPDLGCDEDGNYVCDLCG